VNVRTPLLALLLLGCANHAFLTPVALSTVSAGTSTAVPIGPVSVLHCDKLFGFVPIFRDERKLTEDLLDASRAKGGQGVIDVEFTSEKQFLAFLLYIPIYGRFCSTATGIAVRFE
jgi:hypothetical protein